jgi:hypothetical protein
MEPVYQYMDGKFYRGILRYVGYALPVDMIIMEGLQRPVIVVPDTVVKSRFPEALVIPALTTVIINVKISEAIWPSIE